VLVIIVIGHVQVLDSFTEQPHKNISGSFVLNMKTHSLVIFLRFTGHVQVRKQNGDVIGFLWSAFGVGTDEMFACFPTNVDN
jgi:hypothetical protein